jgi:hypothetical protein
VAFAIFLELRVGVIDGFRWCILGGQISTPARFLVNRALTFLTWLGIRQFENGKGL